VCYCSLPLHDPVEGSHDNLHPAACRISSRVPNSRRWPARGINSFALPRYAINGVLLIFSIFAFTGIMAAIFMVETRGQALEKLSP
jgi:hypothetical protein